MYFARRLSGEGEITPIDIQDGAVRMRSVPHLVVRVFSDLVTVEAEHEFDSGQMWFTQNQGVVGRALTAELDTLAPLLGVDEVARIRAIQGHPEGWTTTERDGWCQHVFTTLFTAGNDTGISPVKPEAAAFYSLERSVNNDDKAPRLGLRLGRGHDDIVLSHGFDPKRGPRLELLHRLDPPATPEALAIIERRFGAELGEVAAWFDRTCRRT